MRLSILCVTKAEPFTPPFLYDLVQLGQQIGAQVVFAADGPEAVQRLTGLAGVKIVPVQSRGFLESVLDTAVEACDGEYVLRLDDDEKCSPAMKGWLERESYTAAPHWKFARAHLWHSAMFCIMEAPLWPDHQTRLSLKHLAGGRRSIHAGSPFGGGRLAPVIIEHHKFLVKSYKERAAIAARYDSFGIGLGTGGFLPFNLPEDAYPNGALLKTVNYAEAEAVKDSIAFSKCEP